MESVNNFNGALIPCLVELGDSAPSDNFAANCAYAALSSVANKCASHADGTQGRKWLADLVVTLLRGLENSSADVRLRIIDCMQVIVGDVREPMLSVLPEMIPLLAEALDDEDESVEMRVRQLVASLENILGDPILPSMQK
eukprot:CAMPEP_0182450668 /NCGR_PEP_ID=MMETSP1172-20130603/42838_1 /TAXON_ID=708627 /ORGANISM="Timspurckia oligopyrenoides, Strain CCMP3278" /LENGTH=140 /DNA_ID=CAMNT_0024648357 /DNA_START=13 /DNA_END=435 /DNA_ORIENTATION=+